MRDKKWIDCPICGSKGSMRLRRNIRQRLKPKDYPEFDITGLDGQFCKVCDDGFLSPAASRKWTASISEHKARYDATRLSIADVASVQDAAKSLGVTVQAVHKMMKEGRIRSVYVANFRLPLRSELTVEKRNQLRNKKRIAA